MELPANIVTPTVRANLCFAPRYVLKFCTGFHRTCESRVCRYCKCRDHCPRRRLFAHPARIAILIYLSFSLGRREKYGKFIQS